MRPRFPGSPSITLFVCLGLALTTSCSDSIAPVSPTVHGETSNRSAVWQNVHLGYIRVGQWQYAYGPSDQPRDAGNYARSFQVANIDHLERITYPREWWVGDSLYRLLVTSLEWTGPGSGCTGQTTISFVSTSDGSCLAQNATFNYAITNPVTETPLGVTISGPTVITAVASPTFTATRTGSPYQVTSYVSWERSTNGGASWTSWCYGTMSCTLPTQSTSFLFRVRVAGTYHRRTSSGEAINYQCATCNPIWATDTVYATSSPISVTVLPPAPPMSASMTGPTSVYPWTNETWTVNVSGGYPPYTYTWYRNGVLSQSGYDTYSAGFSPYQTVYLDVVVTDTQGSQVSTGVTIAVSEYCGDPPCDVTSKRKKPPVRAIAKPRGQ